MDLELKIERDKPMTNRDDAYHGEYNMLCAGPIDALFGKNQSMVLHASNEKKYPSAYPCSIDHINGVFWIYINVRGVICKPLLVSALRQRLSNAYKDGEVFYLWATDKVEIESK